MDLLRAQGVLFRRLQMHAMLFDMFFEYANVINTRLSKPSKALVSLSMPSCFWKVCTLHQSHKPCMQSGVELGVFMKEAMQAAGGVPFAELTPEAICAALRKYETVRSERVALIIKKSAWVGKGIRRSNALVSLIQNMHLFQELGLVVDLFHVLPGLQEVHVLLFDLAQLSKLQSMHACGQCTYRPFSACFWASGQHHSQGKRK